MTKFKSFIHEIISFSPIKTLIFNLHYFGIIGFSFPVIIGKKFMLQTLKGSVIPDECIVAAGSTICKSFSQKGLLLDSINSILKEQVQWTP